MIFMECFALLFNISFHVDIDLHNFDIFIFYYNYHFHLHSCLCYLMFGIYSNVSLQLFFEFFILFHFSVPLKIDDTFFKWRDLLTFFKSYILKIYFPFSHYDDQLSLMITCL